MPTLTIRKSGNAQIVSLPKNFLQQLGVGTGDLLNAKLEGGYIVLTPKPAENQELQMRLEKMFEGVTPETYRTDEDIEWMNMPSVGREILP